MSYLTLSVWNCTELFIDVTATKKLYVTSFILSAADIHRRGRVLMLVLLFTNTVVFTELWNMLGLHSEELSSNTVMLMPYKN